MSDMNLLASSCNWRLGAEIEPRAIHTSLVNSQLASFIFSSAARVSCVNSSTTLRLFPPICCSVSLIFAVELSMSRMSSLTSAVATLISASAYARFAGVGAFRLESSNRACSRGDPGFLIARDCFSVYIMTHISRFCQLFITPTL